MPEPNGIRARSFWSGTLTFGLVSIPVEMVTAVRGRQTSMKLVDDRGHPLGREYYCPADRETLANEDIVRGYELAEGEVVVVSDEELEAVAPEQSRDISLRRFVPRDQIPPMYFVRSYFLMPAAQSTKAYYLLAETIERTGRVGIATMVMRGKEYLVAVLADGPVLRAETMRFPEELRTPADVDLPEKEAAPKAKVRAFEKAIEQRTKSELDIDELSDRYAEQLHELAEQKAERGEGLVVVEPATVADEDEGDAEAGRPVDLMQILRRQLASNVQQAGAVSTSKRRPAKLGKAPAAPAKRRKVRAQRRPKRASPSRAELKELSLRELRERAQTVGLAGRSKMTKAELVTALARSA